MFLLLTPVTHPPFPVSTLTIYNKLTVDSSDESRLRIYNCTVSSTAPFSEKEHVIDVNSGSNKSCHTNKSNHSETNMAYLEHPKGTHDRRKSEVSRRQLFVYIKKIPFKFYSEKLQFDLNTFAKRSIESLFLSSFLCIVLISKFTHVFYYM